MHRSCLDQWRSSNEDRAFSKCTECLSAYRMISPPDLEDSRVTFWRNMRFSCYCARYISVILLIVHILVFFCSTLVYYGDNKRHVLIHFVHFEHYPKTFYYFCGLLLFFACVGFCFLIGLLTNNSPTRRVGVCHCHDPMSPSCMCCDVAPRGGNHYCCSYPHMHCCGVEGEGCCQSYGCTICDCSFCEGGGGCGSCHGCDLGGAACEGEGAMVFGLVIVCVLAVIGIFICAALGMKGIKEISERHVHMLRKRTLVNDFMVCDLAADADTEGGVDLEMGIVGGGRGNRRSGSSQEYGQVSQYDASSSSSSTSSSDIYNAQNDEMERTYFSAQQQRILNRMGLN